MSLRSSTLFGALLAALLAISGPAMAMDLFGHPDAGSPPAAAAPQPAPKPLIAFPAPVRAVFGGIMAMQRDLNAELREELQLAKAGTSWRPAAMIVLFSFLYGVFHAIGPGHGKVVVTGYVLARRSRLLQGLAMSAAAALVQALSAIVLVGGLVAVLRVSARQVLDQAAALEAVSYGLIAVLGATMIWNVATKRDCCAEADHAGHDHHEHHDHDHDHHGHDHDHHGHDHGAPAAAEPAWRQWMHLLGTGGAVGLRPCTGAILVLLFTLANNMLPVGILATFAMALGVCITVSAVSLTAIGARSLTPALAGDRETLLRRVMAYGGAFAITAFGLLQAVGLWTGLLTPALG